MSAITISAGPRTETIGRQVLVTGPYELAEALTRSPATTEAWWSPHIWSGGRREDRWLSAAALVVDADYAGHATPPPDVAERLEQAALAEDLAGNVFHLTPHGARFVFVPAEPITDRALAERAIEGACIAVQRSLTECGFGDYSVDAEATDLARFMWGPNSIVKDEPRHATVHVINPRPWSVDALSALAPEPAPPAARRDPVYATSGSEELLEAVARFNTDNRQDWGRPGGGECPTCGHKDCFGRLPGIPEKWCCFSSNHATDSGRVGILTSKGRWIGDVLDIEAWRMKRPRADVLRADGYLTDREIPPPAEPAPPHKNGSAPKKRFMATDLGNSERIAQGANDRLRYCHPWKQWQVWDDHRWDMDRSGRPVIIAKRIIRALYSEAKKMTDPDRRSALAKHAIQSESSARITAMLELAKSDPRIAILPEQLDGPATHYLFNVQNGTIDLLTGELREHRREDYITRLSPASYRRGARSKLWEDFLETVLPDAEERAFLQRFMGSALTGDSSDQKLVLFNGSGANGKSTLIEAVMGVMGDYAHKIAFETLLETQGKGAQQGGPRVDLMALKGIRLAAAVEAGEGRRLNEAIIKELTGGDTITARGNHQNVMTSFKPEFKLVLAVNHKPEIRGSDESTWRRILDLRFSVTIPESERDPNLASRLRESEHQEDVLVWLVEGCRSWLSAPSFDRLRAPISVLDSSKAYRKDQDVVMPFIDDCCDVGTAYHVTSKDLRFAYEQYCKENGEHPVSAKFMGRRLEEHGFVSGKFGRGNNQQRGWVGIGLKSAPHQQDLGTRGDA